MGSNRGGCLPFKLSLIVPNLARRAGKLVGNKFDGARWPRDLPFDSQQGVRVIAAFEGKSDALARKVLKLGRARVGQGAPNEIDAL